MRGLHALALSGSTLRKEVYPKQSPRPGAVLYPAPGRTGQSLKVGDLSGIPSHLARENIFRIPRASAANVTTARPPHRSLVARGADRLAPAWLPCSRSPEDSSRALRAT